ncbi:MAG: PRC-barrel domain-containing protein [Dehalococcoidia bacterium]|nr:PRC-barrel domain-containing protein [Dehalococcoidia bacterium]
MRSSELTGKEVIDAEAKIVGSVRELDIDIKNWTINGIVIKTGFIKKLIVKTADIDRIGDKVILKVALDKIQKS